MIDAADPVELKRQILAHGGLSALGTFHPIRPTEGIVAVIESRPLSFDEFASRTAECKRRACEIAANLKGKNQ